MAGPTACLTTSNCAPASHAAPSCGMWSRISAALALRALIRRRLALNIRRGILHLAVDPRQIVHSDPEILGGTPVFVGTRVPVDALIDFLEGGDPIEDFLENYPGVSRDQVFAFLEEASRARFAEIA